MAGSSSIRRRLSICILASATIFAMRANAVIKLDKLSACDDLSYVYQTLRTPSETQHCATPRSALEKLLVNKNPASKICIIRAPPAPSLQGFACARTQEGSTAELTCIKSADIRDIEYYKAHSRDEFSGTVSTYLSKAKVCRISNGDTSIAVSTLFPPLLWPISQFQFGYVNALGKDRPSRSHALHGFSSIDPSLEDEEMPSALEFVYVLVNAPATVLDRGKAIGHWLLYVDDNTDFDRPFNAQLRRAHTPIRVASISYDLSRQTSISDETKEHHSMLLKQLQSQIIERLTDEGFRVVSDDELKSMGQTTVDQMSKHFSDSGVPIGIRQFSPLKNGASWSVQVNENRPSCTAGGKGAVLSYLAAVNPDPDIKTDYGSIWLIFAGIGPCAVPTSSTNAFVDGLRSDTTKEIADTLERMTGE